MQQVISKVYLDPGAWSLALQVILGAVISIPVFMGLYWKKIKLFITGKKDDNSRETIRNT